MSTIFNRKDTSPKLTVIFLNDSCFLIMKYLVNNMKYKIKKMTILNYDNIIKFWKSIDGLNITEDDCYDGLKIYLERNPKLNYIVINDGKIIGTIKCGHDGRRGYLHHLAVDNNYRGKGIGKKLIKLCLDELKNQGIKKCNLFVLDTNINGLDFWKHNKWEEISYFYRTFQKSTKEEE